MKILENIKEYEVRKTKDGKFVLVFFKQNDKIYLENCDSITWSIINNILTVRYNHHKLSKTFEFKNIEKRTHYLVNKKKIISLCELSQENSADNLIYSIPKE